MHKTAATEEAAWGMQDKRVGQPHGWVQWKGTDVCMDVYCKCGKHTHVDADFTYNIQCPYCGTTYAVNGHVEFIELEQTPSHYVVADAGDDAARCTCGYLNDHGDVCPNCGESL